MEEQGGMKKQKPSSPLSNWQVLLHRVRLQTKLAERFLQVDSLEPALCSQVKNDHRAASLLLEYSISLDRYPNSWLEIVGITWKCSHPTKSGAAINSCLAVPTSLACEKPQSTGCHDENPQNRVFYRNRFIIWAVAAVRYHPSAAGVVSFGVAGKPFNGLRDGSWISNDQRFIPLVDDGSSPLGHNCPLLAVWSYSMPSRRNLWMYKSKIIDIQFSSWSFGWTGHTENWKPKGNNT